MLIVAVKVTSIIDTVLTMEADSISVSENIGLVDICARISEKAAIDIAVTFRSSPLTATGKYIKLLKLW